MNVVLFFYFVIGYHEPFFQTSCCIIYKQRVTFGKCYESCIVFFLLIAYQESFFQTSCYIIYK